MQVWVNGRLRSVDEPVLSVLDHGFTVGDGVFESVKVTDGRPFALTRHLERLAFSARGLGLSEPDDAAVREGVSAVLAAKHLDLGRLRITYTAGVSPLGSGRGDAPPTLVVAAAPMTAWEEPARVITVPWPRNERGAVVGLKTTSYAENVVALAHAARQGAQEAIFPNLAGQLCEGTGSNVFYAVDGQLRTPTLASGCLAGITRTLVLEWCRERLDVREIDEPIEVAESAEEVFLASTTRDIQPVAVWNGRQLDAPGPLTRAATKIWRDREAENLDP